jgi:hypothetical protein
MPEYSLSYESATITHEKPIYWIPKEVKEFYVVTKYSYGGYTYKHLSKNLFDDHEPPKPENMTFRLPIRSVLVHDHETHAPLFNITKKFKRYAGPYGDFGNQEITPHDLLLGLKDEDFYISIEDIVGNIQIIQSSDLVAK